MFIISTCYLAPRYLVYTLSGSLCNVLCCLRSCVTFQLCIPSSGVPIDSLVLLSV